MFGCECGAVWFLNDYRVGAFRKLPDAQDEQLIGRSAQELTGASTAASSRIKTGGHKVAESGDVVSRVLLRRVR